MTESEDNVEAKEEVLEEKDEVKEPVIKSKSRLTEEIKKKQRHLLIFGGSSGLGKSILGETLARDLNLRLVLTEKKPSYFKGNNTIQLNNWDDLKREVMAIREPIVIDSITYLYQDIMDITPWWEQNKIIKDIKAMMSHMQKYGGLIIAHGETKVIQHDDIGEGVGNTPEEKSKSIPQVQFKVYGNQSWLFRKTGLVVIGRHVISNKKRLLFEGNFIPRCVYEVEITKGSNGEPIVSGKGYEYLKYLLGNSIEYLQSKGSK